ncbi:hypothetical protein KIN20_031464 [Parelaphostrongylus tenuis]|uniref:Uncharacterized protein n=1 Tax=Parelaphostrongylus tenuis TaxID=148309 RepID=A0AAD5R5K2_PARTN|nr:hypothetical protein KIN20_031464 [Parelaphostrongylus tenuis]
MAEKNWSESRLRYCNGSEHTPQIGRNNVTLPDDLVPRRRRQGPAHGSREELLECHDDDSIVDVVTVDAAVDEAIKELIALKLGRPFKKFRGRFAKEKQAIRDAKRAEKVAIEQRELPGLDLLLKAIEDSTLELPIEFVDSSVIHDTNLLHEVGEVLKELVAEVSLEELRPKTSRSRRCWDHLPGRCLCNDDPRYAGFSPMPVSSVHQCFTGNHAKVQVLLLVVYGAVFHRVFGPFWNCNRRKCPQKKAKSRMSPLHLALPAFEGTLASAFMQYEAGVKSILDQLQCTKSVVEFEARMHSLLHEMNMAVALSSQTEMYSSYIQRFEEWNRKTNHFSTIYNNVYGLALSSIKHITNPNAPSRLQSMTRWNSERRPSESSEKVFFVDSTPFFEVGTCPLANADFDVSGDFCLRYFSD